MKLKDLLEEMIKDTITVEIVDGNKILKTFKDIEITISENNDGEKTYSFPKHSIDKLSNGDYVIDSFDIIDEVAEKDVNDDLTLVQLETK